MSKDWESSLFNIEDIKKEPKLDLACAFCCPCFTSALSRTKNDNSSLCFNFCCMTTAASRNVMRTKNGIRGSWLSDAFCSFFCPCFVSRQMLHEAKVMNFETGPVDIKGPLRQSMDDFLDEAKELNKKKEEKEEEKKEEYLEEKEEEKEEVKD